MAHNSPTDVKKLIDEHYDRLQLSPDHVARPQDLELLWNEEFRRILTNPLLYSVHSHSKPYPGGGRYDMITVTFKVEGSPDIIQSYLQRFFVSTLQKVGWTGISQDNRHTYVIAVIWSTKEFTADGEQI